MSTSPIRVASYAHASHHFAGPSEFVDMDGTPYTKDTQNFRTHGDIVVKAVSFGLGGLLSASLFYIWHKISTKKNTWAMAAATWEPDYDPTDDFPGPGNPDVSHEVKIVWDGTERTINVTENKSVLMACEEAGMELPYLCRNGVCLTCTGKILEGFGPEVRKDSQCHNEDNINDGYICTCSTYIGGPGVKIQMGMQDEAYKKQFGRFEEEEKQREQQKKKLFGLF